MASYENVFIKEHKLPRFTKRISLAMYVIYSILSKENTWTAQIHENNKKSTLICKGSMIAIK